MTAGSEMSCDTRSSKHWMLGWEALLLVRKVEQDVLDGVMSPALAMQKQLVTVIREANYVNAGGPAACCDQCSAQHCTTVLGTTLTFPFLTRCSSSMPRKLSTAAQAMPV